VDSAATEATFTVAWPTPTSASRMVSRASPTVGHPAARSQGPAAASCLQLCPPHRGSGYVAFKLEEPLPGQCMWKSPPPKNHVRYTVGGFVRSPLRLLVDFGPTPIAAGSRSISPRRF